MAQSRRWKLSAMQRTEMWSRWKLGQSFHEIGRAFGKDHGVIDFMLSQHGGIVPAVRHRSLRTLTLAERENISRGIASGSSLRGIAKGLKRAISTVSREVARHGGRPLYRASEADQQAWQSALRPKPCRLATHRKLQQIVASKLLLDWSPRQISRAVAAATPAAFFPPRSTASTSVAHPDSAPVPATGSSPACACAPACDGARATASRPARPPWAPRSVENDPPLEASAAASHLAGRSSASARNWRESSRHPLSTPHVPTPPAFARTTAIARWLRCPLVR